MKIGEPFLTAILGFGFQGKHNMYGADVHNAGRTGPLIPTEKLLGWPLRRGDDVDIAAAWLWDDGVPNEWT